MLCVNKFVTESALSQALREYSAWAAGIPLATFPHVVRLSFILVLSFLVSRLSFAQEAKDSSIAFIGDSISTGAFAHPGQKWNLKEVGEFLVKGAPSPELEAYADDFKKSVPVDGRIGSPRRVWHSLAHPIGGILDMEEYSWGYLVGREQGIPPRNIMIAAEKGAHSGNTAQQVDVLLASTKKSVPDQTFMYFTGNDLCHHDPHPGEPFDFERETNQFRDDLLAGVDRLIAATPAGEGPVKKIHLMKFLPVVDLIKKEAVRNKVVEAYGMKMKCERMRSIPPAEIPPPAEEDEVGKGALSLIRTLAAFGALHVGKDDLKSIPPITSVCRGLLSTRAEDAPRIEFFEKLVAALNRGVELAVKEGNRRASDAKKPIQITLLESPSTFDVEAADIGEDCFHLSLRGQEKLARLVQKELKEKAEAGAARDSGQGH